MFCLNILVIDFLLCKIAPRNWCILICVQAEEPAAENKHKAWQKPSKGKKKTKSKKAKPAFQWKKQVQSVGAKSEQENTAEAATDEVGFAPMTQQWSIGENELAVVFMRKTMVFREENGFTMVFMGENGPAMVFMWGNGPAMVFKGGNGHAMVFFGENGPAMVFMGGNGPAMVFMGEKWSGNGLYGRKSTCNGFYRGISTTCSNGLYGGKSTSDGLSRKWFRCTQ